MKHVVQRRWFAASGPRSDWWRLAQACMAVLSVSVALPARAAEPKATLVTPVAGITVSVTAPVAAAASAPPGLPARGSLLVAVEGLDPIARPAEGQPGFLSKPEDLPQAASAALDIQFEAPLALAPGAGQRNWVLPFRVQGLPEGADQTRYLGFKLGGQDRTLAWRLTSPAAPPASTWALKPVPPAERAIWPEDGVPIGITITGTQPVRGLRLGPVELVEQGSRRTLTSGRLALCKTMAPCESKAIDGSGNDLSTLWLMPLMSAGKSIEPLPPGKYVGHLTIASSDKPGGETVALTIQISSPFSQFLGVLAIFIGVALAWFSTTYLRYRINRNQMRLPALAWSETAARLRAQLTALGLPPGLSGVSARLAAIDEALSDAALERNQLPPAVPLPGSTAISSTAMESYRKYLDGVGAWVTALQIIIEHGLQPLQARRAGLLAKGKAHVDALDHTLQVLDGLARSATTPVADTVAQHVAQQLAEFDAALARLDAPLAMPGARAVDSASAHAAAPRLTVEQLRLQIAGEGFAAWGFILATTLAAGSYMLVFKNPGFGTPLDLLEALLWGLGLPAAAQLTASTTTPTTIASTFSVLR